MKGPHSSSRTIASPNLPPHIPLPLSTLTPLPSSPFHRSMLVQRPLLKLMHADRHADKPTATEPRQRGPEFVDLFRTFRRYTLSVEKKVERSRLTIDSSLDVMSGLKFHHFTVMKSLSNKQLIHRCKSLPCKLQACVLYNQTTGEALCPENTRRECGLVYGAPHERPEIRHDKDEPENKSRLRPNKEDTNPDGARRESRRSRFDC